MFMQSNYQPEIMEKAFDSALSIVIKELQKITDFEARNIFIETFVTMFARGIVPMSGLTVQQHINVAEEKLKELNTLAGKSNAFKNGTDARYIYHFAREATSGGILPVYRDKKTGDLYVGLVCNKRNVGMYNWSAGYTEAPLPAWLGKLKSHTVQDIYYDRSKIKESAMKTMKKALEAAGGDWTKVDYNHKQFADGFKEDNVLLPNVDINSFHTASRECIEEINLDLDQFPDKKISIISFDNTVGISQGDAPGQTSNRSHQYLAYLGELDRQPVIQPGDDVAIADWVKVSDIQRKSAMDYIANEKSICVYMLRGLECAFKEVWCSLIQQASTQVSRYSGKSTVRFSNPENVMAEIESFADRNGINLEGTSIARFLQIFSDEAFKTYTGKSAQLVLNCLLAVTRYLTSSELKADNFVKIMTSLLTPLDVPSKLYCSSTNLFYLKNGISEQKKGNVVVVQDQALSAPKFSMSPAEQE